MIEIDIPPQNMPAVIAAVAGLGGALLTQVLAGVITSRRETKARKARRADARASAFAEIKQKVFASTLRALDTAIDQFEAFAQKQAAAARGEQVSMSIPARAWDRTLFDDLKADLDLLAPDVVPSVNECIVQMESLDFFFALKVADGAKVHEEITLLRRTRNRVRDAMRRSLNVEEPPPRLRQWLSERRARWARRKTRKSGTASS